ncbi:hypothetical protein GW17_00033193, partial [Ensete ventricosum]
VAEQLGGASAEPRPVTGSTEPVGLCHPFFIPSHPLPEANHASSPICRTSPTLSLNKGFSRVLAYTPITILPKDATFSLPNWRNGKNESRTRELRLHEAFVHLEYMVGRGHRRDATQASQLLYDLCRSNKIRKAIRIMELMVRSESTPDSSAYTSLINQLCKRGNVGYAMQLVNKMREYACPPSMITYNSLVRGLCTHGNLQQSLQLFWID